MARAVQATQQELEVIWRHLMVRGLPFFILAPVIGLIVGLFIPDEWNHGTDLWLNGSFIALLILAWGLAWRTPHWLSLKLLGKFLIHGALLFVITKIGLLLLLRSAQSPLIEMVETMVWIGIDPVL